MNKQATAVSAFVAKTANPFMDCDLAIPQPLLDTAITVAVQNKVLPLFYEGCVKHDIKLPPRVTRLMAELERRRIEQRKAMHRVTDLCQQMCIDFTFYKTLRPYSYVPDDIDLLVKRASDLDRLVQALIADGYRVLKVGTPEVTLQKVLSDTYVALDVHTSIAAGHLRFFPRGTLWDHVVPHMLDDGSTIPVLTEAYEVVNAAAYALFKDFSINLATFYTAIYGLSHLDRCELAHIAEGEVLQYPLEIMFSATNHLNHRLYGKTLDITHQSRTYLTSLIISTLGQLQLPYPYPVPITVYGYAWKTLGELHKRNRSVLPQVIKQPSSKGIAILFQYFKQLRGS